MRCFTPTGVTLATCCQCCEATRGIKTVTNHRVSFIFAWLYSGKPVLSFSDSIDALARKMIEGQVWMIPKGSRIPGSLVFNIKDIDHPLLNVSKRMSVLELTALLTELSAFMEPCDVKIDRHGKIVEKYPGALMKVVNL